MATFKMEEIAEVCGMIAMYHWRSQRQLKNDGFDSTRKNEKLLPHVCIPALVRSMDSLSSYGKAENSSDASQCVDTATGASFLNEKGS